MRRLEHEHMRSSALLIGLCFALSVLPLASTMMPWVWILFICALGVVWARVLKKIKPLNSLTLNLLAIFCMLLLVFYSGQFGLLSTMINLLVVAGCLKLITMRSFADFHLIIVVVIFLVACGFIYHQDLLLTVYFSLVLFATVASTFMLNKGKLRLSASFTHSFKLIAQTLPITVLLFVMVPRLPPLWEAAANKSSSTGLSETMTPGDIASLAQSSDLAFRAEFTDYIPQPQERYWRSIVLQYFDGKSWTLGDELSNIENTPSIQPIGEPTRYLIVAEPNDTRWQYSLDLPVVEEVMSDRSIMRNSAYQLFTDKKNTKKSLYIVNSYLSSPLNFFMSEYDLKRNLQVPDEYNPRTQAFVASRISAGMSTEQKVSSLMSVFLEQEFTYTLRPPLMQVAPIDEFLFEHQRGFCSHYASALSYMLRLADVPARIVAGYQGGELQNENIITVRQYDAHAWVEYWNEQSGWTRLDPTALVAPNRLIEGLFSSISQEESELVEQTFNLSTFRNVPVFKQMRDFFVMIDHKWTQSVLRYDQDAQRDLIKKWFGEFNAKNLTTFMFLALGAIAIFIALLFLPYRKWLARRPEQAETRLLALLKQHGFEKQHHETLQQFTQRISPLLEEAQRKPLAVFTQRFYDSKYGNHARPAEDLHRLVYLLKRALKTKAIQGA